MFESISRGVLTCQNVRQINQSNRSDHSLDQLRGKRSVFGNPKRERGMFEFAR